MLGAAFQALLQAAKVGQMPIELREGMTQVEFVQRAGQDAGIAKSQAFNLMALARNQPLLELHKPESRAAALRLHLLPPPAPAPSGLQSLLERVFAPRCRADGD